MHKFFIAAAFAASLGASASAQTQVKGATAPEPRPAGVTQLASPENARMGVRRECTVEDVAITIGGIALQCLDNPLTPEQDAWVASFDGGENPGAVSAAMVMLMQTLSNEEGRLYKDKPNHGGYGIEIIARKRVTPACAAYSRRGAGDCYEVVAMQPKLFDRP